jgi:hypothetical protein
VVFGGLDGLLSHAREMQNRALSQAREKRPMGLFLAVQARAGAGERMVSPPVFSREGRKCRGGEEQRRKSSALAVPTRRRDRAGATVARRRDVAGVEEKQRGRLRGCGGGALRGGRADAEERQCVSPAPVRRTAARRKDAGVEERAGDAKTRRRRAARGLRQRGGVAARRACIGADDVVHEAQWRKLES